MPHRHASTLHETVNSLARDIASSDNFWTDYIEVYLLIRDHEPASTVDLPTGWDMLSSPSDPDSWQKYPASNPFTRQIVRSALKTLAWPADQPLTVGQLKRLQRLLGPYYDYAVSAYGYASAPNPFSSLKDLEAMVLRAQSDARKAAR